MARVEIFFSPSKKFKIKFNINPFKTGVSESIYRRGRGGGELRFRPSPPGPAVHDHSPVFQEKRSETNKFNRSGAGEVLRNCQMKRSEILSQFTIL